jgi:eukaryotic-like serine/threonine-protein kinase
MLRQPENFRHRFEMKQELGRGATGEVYLAHDLYFQRDVAIKLTRLKSFDDPETGHSNRKMWLNETRLAGKLQHPFIVQTFEAGNVDDFDYLVMEYVAGGTLKQFTTYDKLLPIDRLIDILYKVCNALDYANKMGILHRDIKPANVLLGEDNSVKVSDFGAAYCTDSEVTQVFLVGTLPFIPPEHFRHAQPSIQSDIYAVGVMAYQLLTGKLPFTADTHEGLIYQKLQGDSVPLERRRHDIPQALRFAVHRAMHKDAEMRYNSWKAFCDDIAAALPHLTRPEEAQFDCAHFDALRNLVFFSGFTDVEIWETVGISRWQKWDGGETIVQEGEKGHSLFIITGGEAVVTKSGTELSFMKVGDCFGEIAYLDDSQHLRAASVKATTSVKVIEIEGESLRQASAGLQARFARAFLGLLVARVGEADQRLLSVLGIG